MPYIGKSPSVGLRTRYNYTATAGQTSFSGADNNNVTLTYTDTNYTDVYLNGTLLLAVTDYASTTGTSIVLTSGASLNDVLEVVVYDAFSVADTVSAVDGGAFASNVSFGADISSSTLGTSNFRAGVNAGNSIESGGNFNVAVGDEAGTALTTGDNNVLMGYAAGDALTTSVRNTAVGTEALSSATTGDNNTAIGFKALFTNVDGDRNVAVGVGSLQTFEPSAGDTYNVAVGFDAGNKVTTGTNNTLIGGLAGDALTTGANNTVLGKGALSAGTESHSNIAIGISALASDTKGARSIAIGVGALDTQNFTTATNTYNIAVGYDAGTAITTGIRNNLFGAEAGDALTDADDNIAIGYQALTADTLGSRSVAIGNNALDAQNFTTATNTYNTAVGYAAGGAVNTGVQNTLIGGQAGDAITTGSDNVMIGYVAGTNDVNFQTGSRCVIIGALADSTTTGATDAQVIGYNVSGQGGYTTLGSGTDDIRAQNGVATWATVSDERYKKDIVDSTAGLSFINALKPRTFKYKNLGELPETFNAYKAGSTDVFKNSNTNHGFIAQEVKTAIDADSSIKDGFRLWDDREDGSQEVAESALIPVLTKAVQELSTALDAALARIATLEG